MSINRLISIKNPILDALDMLGIDRTNNMPILMTWAMRAEKAIGGVGSFKRQKKVLDICGCKAELPCNVEKLEAAILGLQDCSCNDIRDYCPAAFIQSSGTSASDTAGFLVADLPTDGFTNFNYIDYEIQNNAIVFHTNLDGQKVTIQYSGYELDEDGLFPMVSENHIRAIQEYILWQYAKRSKYSSNPLSDNLITMNQREWFRLASNARAQDAELNPSEQESIAQMLSNPYSGRGLYVGMSLANWNRW